MSRILRTYRTYRHSAQTPTASDQATCGNSSVPSRAESPRRKRGHTTFLDPIAEKVVCPLFPRFEDNCPGRATVELITLASFDEFKPWLGTDWRQRGDDYEALK